VAAGKLVYVYTQGKTPFYSQVQTVLIKDRALARTEKDLKSSTFWIQISFDSENSELFILKVLGI